MRYNTNMKEQFSNRVALTDEYREAVATNADRWVAACGGDEQPFSHNGTEYLYVFNPKRGEHGYLNQGTDIVEEEIFFLS